MAGGGGGAETHTEERKTEGEEGDRTNVCDRTREREGRKRDTENNEGQFKVVPL